MERRDFIAGTAAAGILAAVASWSPAFARTSNRLRLAMIGTWCGRAWSAITPLSEQSIAEGGKTVDFPDFTKGRWRRRKPSFALEAA